MPEDAGKKIPVSAMGVMAFGLQDSTYNPASFVARRAPDNALSSYNKFMLWFKLFIC